MYMYCTSAPRNAGKQALTFLAFGQSDVVPASSQFASTFVIAASCLVYVVLSMSKSNSTVVDITYRDSRTGELMRERRIQEMPAEEMDNVRQRELASMRMNGFDTSKSLVRREPRDDDDDQEYVVRRKVTRQMYSDDDLRGARRRNYSPADGSSRSRSRSRRRSGRRRHSDGRSHHGGGERRAEKDVDDFWHKNFDTTYEGIFSATAGAAVGALAASRLDKDKHFDDSRDGRGGKPRQSAWKTLGGAVLGAAAFNAAEHRYRVYEDEKDGRRR